MHKTKAQMLLLNWYVIGPRYFILKGFLCGSKIIPDLRNTEVGLCNR